MRVKLPQKHQLEIQAASYEIASCWQEDERDSQHDVWCKFGMGIGALVVLGSLTNNREIGHFAGGLGLIFTFLCFCYSYEIKRRRSGRYEIERVVRRDMEKIGVYMTHNGLSASLIDKEGSEDFEFFNPRDANSYE